MLSTNFLLPNYYKAVIHQPLYIFLLGIHWQQDQWNHDTIFFAQVMSMRLCTPTSRDIFSEYCTSSRHMSGFTWFKSIFMACALLIPPTNIFLLSFYLARTISECMCIISTTNMNSIDTEFKIHPLCTIILFLARVHMHQYPCHSSLICLAINPHTISESHDFS